MTRLRRQEVNRRIHMASREFIWRAPQRYPLRRRIWIVAFQSPRRPSTLLLSPLNLILTFRRLRRTRARRRAVTEDDVA